MIAVCRRIGVALFAASLLAACAESYQPVLRPEGVRATRGGGAAKQKPQNNNGQKRGQQGRRGNGNGNNGRGNGRG